MWQGVVCYSIKYLTSFVFTISYLTKSFRVAGQPNRLHPKRIRILYEHIHTRNHTARFTETHLVHDLKLFVSHIWNYNTPYTNFIHNNFEQTCFFMLRFLSVCCFLFSWRQKRYGEGIYRVDYGRSNFFLFVVPFFLKIDTEHRHYLLKYMHTNFIPYHKQSIAPNTSVDMYCYLHRIKFYI